MTIVEDFRNYCFQTLEVNFGQLSGDIVKGVMAKKNLTEKSSLNDFNEFIYLIEVNISVFSGRNKAAEICNNIRAKAIEFMGNQNLKQTPLSGDIEREMNAFLAKNSLPTEGDVTDYSKYLAMKYGGKAKKVEKDLIEKVKSHVKIAISKKKINEEINNFLDRFPDALEKDVFDFITYLKLEKLTSHEEDVREAIEKERLYRKFNGEQMAEEPTNELDQFIDIIKTQDKKGITKAMKQHEISYLIKDESGKSDDILSDFVSLTPPSEDDVKSALEGMGLKHMIKKN